ncbi:MAG: DUF4954 domain-containing protein, partial [Bacteroidota bacterium]
FLCAALVMGQSNIPAGATLGSNHNSRSADGEMLAGRGFWPGLCVSTKHNSRFASFTMLGKGDYNYEMDIQIPFSLVSQDEGENCLQILPGYWFLYNFYALERNAWKYKNRDHREEKIQRLEFDYLAPDTVNELMNAMKIMQMAVGKAWYKNNKEVEQTENDLLNKGNYLLENNDETIDALLILVNGFENSKRKTVLLKTRMAYNVFKKMIRYYAILQFVEFLETQDGKAFASLKKLAISNTKEEKWENIGGQLLPKSKLDQLLKKIKSGTINSWESLHKNYVKAGEEYASDKMKHGLSVLQIILGKKINALTKTDLKNLLEEAIGTRKWIAENVVASREKDYSNPFIIMMHYLFYELQCPCCNCFFL